MPEDFEEQAVVEEASVDAEQEEVSTEAETVETPVTDTPKPDNVGEAIKREVERRTAALEKQFEEKYSPVTKHSSYLEKMARIEGYTSVDDYVRAIDEYERNREVQREAERMQVDPETYARYFQPVNQKATELEQKVQSLESQLTERQQKEQSQAQWGDLYQTYPSLVEDSKAWEKGENPGFFTEQMQELVNMGYKPLHAYELAHKDTLFRQKEQETIARLTGRDAKQVLPSTDSPNNVQFDPDNMSFEDIQALSDRVRRGERVQL